MARRSAAISSFRASYVLIAAVVANAVVAIDDAREFRDGVRAFVEGEGQDGHNARRRDRFE